MHAKEVLKIALTGTQNLFNWYLSDLAEEDLAMRPVPGANNIAWQAGHLINSEVALLKDEMPGATYPDLPASLKDKYSGKTSATPPEGGYLPKEQYIQWFNTVRTATLANLEKITDADLDKPASGPLAKIAPNLAAMILLVSNHTLMHAGQFTTVRRALEKPVLF